MKTLEFIEGRGLRIYIDGQLPTQEDWGYGDGDAHYDPKTAPKLFTFSPLQFGDGLELHKIEFDVTDKEWWEMLKTPKALKVTTSEGEVTLRITEHRIGNLDDSEITVSNGEKTYFDETKTYIRAEVRINNTQLRSE